MKKRNNEFLNQKKELNNQISKNKMFLKSLVLITKKAFKNNKEGLEDFMKEIGGKKKDK
jgi:hypothetical protein